MERSRQGGEHQSRMTSMTEPGAIDCDVHPTRAGHRGAAAASGRRSGGTRRWIARHQLARVDQLSAEIAAHLAAGMARQERLCGDRRRGARRPGVRPLAGRATAILNCLYGVQLVFSEDMAAAFCRALNDYIAKEWLDRDPRLRASIVIPMQNVEYAVDEIERCAKDKRFVQVLVLAMQEVPLGRRHYWPIYAAAERHGLPIGIHAGSAYRNPVTSLGWPTWYIEDYAAQAQGFQSQVGKPDHRGRVRQVSRAQGRADRIGRDLAAGVPVAFRQVLARSSHRGSLGGSRALGDRARPFPPDDPAVRRPGRSGMRWNGSSNTCVPMIYCCMRRTIRIGSSTATTVRAARDFAGAPAQDRGRQSARDLSPGCKEDAR